MLGKTAGGLFWMFRYLERAENTARLVDAGLPVMNQTVLLRGVNDHADTLEALFRGLVKRRVHPDDARRVLLSLSAKGQKLMAEVFPEFNAVEAHVTATLAEKDMLAMARSLRAVVKQAESS